MGDLIYKICTRVEWDKACDEGVFKGSRDDLRDGFIHFSLKHQIENTLRKHFSGKGDLLLLAVDADLLDPAQMKYEISGKGENFPHLYGNLFPSAVTARYNILLDDASEHEVDYDVTY